MTNIFKDAYSMSSVVYDGIIEPALRPLKKRSALLLHEQLKSVSDPLILEIACGTGTQARLLKQAGLRTMVLDKSQAMIRRANRKLNGNRNGQSAVIHGDASNLPFADNAFDAVVLQFSLHEMDRRVRLQTLCEMKRVARKEALFLVVDFIPQAELSFSKACIMTAEILAGAKHFKNGRQFIKSGGLKAFLERNGFNVSLMLSYLHGNVGLALGHSER